MTKKGPRDLGVDKDGYKIHDWEWIKRQVDETGAQTNIDFAKHAAKVRARYDATPSISALAVLKKLLGR